MSPRKPVRASSRRARGSLNEDEILRAAIAIIERDGVDALSMPNLAKQLGAGVMSVYWYFHSKDDLVVALADRAFLDVYSRLPRGGDGAWDEETVAMATALLRELRAAPLYLQLCLAYPACLVLRPTVLPILAERLQGGLTVFRHMKLDGTEAARIATLLFTYVRGFALMQVGADEERTDVSAEEMFEASVGQLSPAKFPTLRAAGNVGTLVSVSDDSFDAGLRVFVSGLRAGFEAITT